MSSLRRIQASRANGAKSRGPVTSEGKARSAKNALKHGLLSTDVVLASESRQTFQELLDALIARWQPADQAELSCIEHMVAAEWRIRRIWTVETRDIDEGMQAWAKSLDDPAEQLSLTMSSHAEMHLLLGRYETRLHTLYHRAFQHLKYLQTHRAPNEPSLDSEHNQDIGQDDTGRDCPSRHASAASGPSPRATEASVDPSGPPTARPRQVQLRPPMRI